MNNEEYPLPTLIRLNEVKRRTGLSRSTIYKWMNENRFPAHKRVGQKAVAWLEQDITRWIDGVSRG
ncbi:AlpA family phage regulatory protein [Acidiferrobacter sp.]|jgi:prophage regulatory protein|uniref:helix-turn-helix transcriptional regulator n=1 Tax=Acidiferrobacter sp. TaxID=1872107 RepID=UPI0026101CFF|nr:AlpA family phage regulatory protein [Acidiferrobacter sp.]